MFKAVNKYTQDLRVHQQHGIREAANNIYQHTNAVIAKEPASVTRGAAQAMEIVRVVRDNGTMSHHDISTLVEFIQDLEETVAETKRQCANQRARVYRDFVKGAVNEKGGRILHRLIKPTQKHVPNQVTTTKGVTSTDQANADHQREIWKKVWDGSDKPITQDEQRWVGIYENQSHEVTQKEIEDFRSIVKRFKKHTAMSFDNLKPHLLGQLSDEALRQLISLYKRAEDEGRWPEQWKLAIMIMIPKAKHGTYRLIALLCAPYRAWAKQAGQAVSRWMYSFNREWLAFGPEKAAETAAYDIALLAEAATNDEEDWCSTIMSDLEKGFEKVLHGHLIVAAHVYNFPLTKITTLHRHV